MGKTIQKPVLKKEYRLCKSAGGQQDRVKRSWHRPEEICMETENSGKKCTARIGKGICREGFAYGR